MAEQPGDVVLDVDQLRTFVARHRSLVRAVDGVSMQVRAGETLGLVGESGCGKSMTAMSIMKLLPPGSYVGGGAIRLGGRDLVPLGDAAMRRVRGNEVAMVFQDPMSSLDPTMPIGKQIAEAIRAHQRMAQRDALVRAEELLRLVGVPVPQERLSAFPHQLSGGLRQRVMIATALSCDPKLLIADEPTTALDSTVQAQILALLDSLKQRLRMAVLHITHDLGVIAGYADRVAVMYAGKIVEEASTEELFLKPQHPYTQALLNAAAPVSAERDAASRAIPGSPPDPANPPRGCRFAPRCSYASPDCERWEPALAGPVGHTYACFHPIGGGNPSPVTGAGRASQRRLVS